MMSQQLDKIEIARSFGRAAKSYDDAAQFQRWVADQVLALYPISNLNVDDVVLDLGCGTGYCLEKLPSKLVGIGLDISIDMVSTARQKLLHLPVSWTVADAEYLPFRDNSIDCCLSSLSIQWCADSSRLLADIKRVLKPGGVFVFSTLLEDSLFELKSSWAVADDAQHVNRFESLTHYQSTIAGECYSDVVLKKHIHALKYQKVRELLAQLKAIGAHNVTPERTRNVTAKSTYRRFEHAYESFRDKEGLLPATYNLLFGVLTK